MSFKISMTMLGSLIGAGFATGKEIVNFFGIYGKFAPYLIVVAGLLFFISLCCFFIAGKYTENRAILYFFNPLIFIAEFILLSAMISAMFSISNIFLSNSTIAYILIILCFIISIFDVNGLTTINTILSPLLILSIITVSTLSIKNNYNPVCLSSESNYIRLILYPFLYFGLNLFTSFPLCRELGKNMTKKEIYLTSFIISITLIATITLIAISIFHSSIKIYNSDMPLAILAFNINKTFGFIFFFVIIAGIITTLLSCLYVLNSYHKKFRIKKLQFSMIIILLAYLFNFIGFSGIISLFYPLIGIFGVALYVFTEINNKRHKFLLSK